MAQTKQQLLRMLLAISVAWTTALIGCSPSPKERAEHKNVPEAPKDGGTLIIARLSDADNLDPQFSSTLNAASVVHQKVYEGLVTRDKNMEFRPLLATEWKQINDVVWEFKLRQGITFHDGTPFTSAAVKKTFDRILDPKTASPRATVFGKVKEVKTVNDYTVQMILTEPFAPLLSILASHEGSIFSPKAIDQYGKDLSKHPVGTGPFSFQSWKPGQEITLVKNKNYWGDKPKIDQVVFRVVPEDTTRISMVETGEAHIAEQLPVTAIEQIESSDKMSVYRSEALGTEYIGFNVKKKPFDDVRVRRAISHAIETEAIIKGVYNNVGTKANSPLGPKVFGYSPEVKTYPYDLNKARELLSEAGYPNGFRTTIWTYDRKDRVNVAEVVQSQLKGIGIDVEVKVMEYGAFVDAIEVKKEHDMFISGWGNATGDADYNQYNLFHTNSNGRGNSFNYTNPELDTLIEAGRKEQAPAKRKEIYAKAQEIEIKDALLVPIRNLEHVTAISKNVQDFWISPSGYLMINEVKIH